MKHSFTFNGRNSHDFGIVVTGVGQYNAPVRQYEKVSVLGRDGELLISEDRYSNVTETYHVAMRYGLQGKTQNLRSWLLKPKGYCQLYDDYNADSYVEARVISGLDFETFMNRGGSADITFERKPQRWLWSGQTGYTFTESTRLYNPTDFDSRPLIRIYGAGMLGIGESAINVITSGQEYIDFDCDLMDAFEGDTNRNSNVEVIGDDPILYGGEGTNIQFGDGITKVVIIPRWWRL